MDIVVLVGLPLIVLPIMVELLHHRLGLSRPWARAGWVLSAAALASWLAPAGIWSGLTAGLFLIPALFLAAAGIARFLTSLRQQVEPGSRRSWVTGQVAISVGLLGPALLGWALVARTLGVEVAPSVVTRALIGATAVGLLAGELGITSGARWGLLAARLAIIAAALALISGPYWLIVAGLALVAAGVCMRREIRPVLPGAPGVDGMVAVAAGLVAALTAGWWPVVAVGAVMTGLVGTAFLWFRVVDRLSEPRDHSGGCSCCADHAEPADQGAAHPG